MLKRRIKIGIDVGGTFTHAVAVNADTLELVGKTMVPTTHSASEGVARGVVDSMHLLLKQARVKPSEVILIAHSTTQATNALLEGDVAPVGIIGMGKGVEGWRAKGQTSIDNLELAPGKLLTTYHHFLDTRVPPSEEAVKGVLKQLRARGAQIFVASEAFGVDDSKNERKVVEIIKGEGYLATSGSEISRLYGLRVRTRTAVINACMMLKMLETANMTEKAVRKSGIKAPLMIMRSDGGIMDINEMRRRPILTMLSGPAAGVAAALMYVRISDGVFLEVGGTSTDISIVRNSRPAVRTGEVGGHRLYVRTLDTRTVGIGGGSMPRFRGRRIVDVGPRSAHIAGLRYISFADPDECRAATVQAIQPRQGDPSDYLALSVEDDRRPSFTFTLTEAANVLGFPKGYAKANGKALWPVAERLAREFHTTPETLSTAMLEVASGKVIDVVESLLEEYKFDRSHLALVGGGGGAETLVPYVAKRLKMEHWITKDADVISAIGVALGMIRDTIERSVVSPTDSDLMSIRSEAMESVIRMGAAPVSVEVRVEVDTRQKRIAATATGAPEMRSRKLTRAKLRPEELSAIAAKSCGVPVGEVNCVGETEFLKVFQATRAEQRLFGLVRRSLSLTRVIDQEGIIRLKLEDARAQPDRVSGLPSTLSRLIDELTTYGDAGALQPDLFVIVSARIIDLSGLATKDQMLSLLRAETESYGNNEPVIALVAHKRL